MRKNNSVLATSLVAILFVYMSAIATVPLSVFIICSSFRQFSVPREDSAH